MVACRSNGMMTGESVVAVVRALEGGGLRVWVDGGWGIDALLGAETRLHVDLDLVIALNSVPAARALLEARGLRVSVNELPTRLALTGEDGSAVDLHPVTFDDEGNGWQRLQDGARFCYSAAGLQADGNIAGERVSCLAPELQAACHDGYEPAETDRADMAVLASRFAIDLPPAYRS